MVLVRKGTSAMVALALLLAALAGCSGGPAVTGATVQPQQTTTQSADVTEVPELAKTWPEFAVKHEVVIECFEMGWTGPVAEKDIVTPEIFKRTNFKLIYKPMTVSSQDELNQKLNLMVASRNVPPIYLGGADEYSLSIYDKLGEAELIWDVAPIKSYKHIYTLIRPEMLKYVSKIDGKNYYIPTQTGRGFDFLTGGVGGLFVREDFLKKLNMDYPKTYEEFYTYLKRCMSEIKESGGQPLIGYTCGESFASLDTLTCGFFSDYRGAFRGSGFFFDPDNDYKMVNQTFAASPQILHMSLYLNKLYREGLIDKEILTHKNVQYEEKFSSGRCAAVGSNGWWTMATCSDNARTIVPELLYVTPLDLVDSVNGEPSKPMKYTYPIVCPSTLTISKQVDEESFRHFLALLDYMATEEGQILVNWGIEGKSYQRDANGKLVFMDQFKTDTDQLDWNKVSSFGVYYWQQVVQNSSILTPQMGEYPELVREDNRKSWENKKLWRDLFDPNMPLTKSMFYTTGEIEMQLMPALDDAYKQFLVKVFLAKDEAEVHAVVEEWGETCQALGIEKIIAEREARIKEIKIEE